MTTNFLLEPLASVLTTVLLTAFYIANPAYLKEPRWLREQVHKRATAAIKEELLRYSKKHID